MSSGAYGLIGVLVGAIVSGGFEWLFLSRREAAERRGREAESQIRVRRAARLVLADLTWELGELDVTLDGGKVVHFAPARRLSNWVECQRELAEAGSTELWSTLVKAVNSAQTAAEIVEDEAEGAPLTEELRSALEYCRRDIEQGVDAAGVFAGD